MAKRRPSLRVALVLSDALRQIGLEWSIRELVEDVFVEHYECFSAFQEANEEAPFDVAFVDSDRVALYGDYFRTRRIHVVLLTEKNISDNEALPEETAVLCMSSSRCELFLQLQRIFDQHDRIQEEALEKTLSPREVDVLKEVARGSTNKEIAEHLNISMNTVMSHRKNITSKLNIKTVSGLTFYALVNGMITGDELMDRP